MNELVVKVKSWLDGLNPRERQIVIGGAAFVLLFLAYQVIWKSVIGRAGYLEEKVAKQQADLIWMKQAAQEIRQLSGSSGRPSGASAGSLLGIIERTARQSNLGNNIRKVQPEGRKGVRVWLDKAPFDDVIKWLDALQTKQGVNVASFSAERQPEAGRVDVRLLIETP